MHKNIKKILFIDKNFIKKNFLLIFISSLICVLLIKNDTLKSIYATFTNDTARIDIKKQNGANEYYFTSGDILIEDPNWCKNKDSSCSVLNFPISEDYKTYNFYFEITKAGKMYINFKSPYVLSYNGNIKKILVNYKNFKSNKFKNFSETKTLWHNEDFNTEIISVKKGDIITFSIDISKHTFKFNDLKTFYNFNYIDCIEYILLFILFFFINSNIFQHINFKIIKNEKLLFSLICITFLSIPLTNISKQNISIQENRTLNKFPKLFQNRKINSKFGLEFNNWFNDRFFGRTFLINLKFKLYCFLNGKTENEQAFIGDDGYMFEKQGTKYIESIKEQKDKIKKFNETLKKFLKKFKKKNISTYITLVPDRNKVLKKYWEQYYDSKQNLDYENELENLTKNEHNIHFVKILDAFIKENKNKPVYYKDDIHLNFTGKRVFTEQIYKIFKHNLDKNIKFVKTIKGDFKSASIANMLGIKKIGKLVWEPHIKLNISNSSNIKYTKLAEDLYEDYHKNIVIPYVSGKTENAPINKTVVFLGPCYTFDIFDDLKYLFSKTHAIRLNLKGFFSDEVVETQIERIKSLFTSDDDIILVFIFSFDPSFFDIANEMLLKSME